MRWCLHKWGRADAILHLCTLLWGTQHAVIKYCIALDESLDGSPQHPTATTQRSLALVTLRFGIAAVLFGLAAFGASGRIGSSRKSLIAGAELGLWSYAGFGLQAVGLMTTTASRSAFLLYLNVKLVPVLQICIDGKVAPLRTWVSAALAVAGTCLIVADGSTPPNSGDLWCAAAAVASAGFIIRMGHYATDTADATVVTATCAAVCVVLGMTTVHVLAVWRRQECWGPAPATCHFAAAAQSAEILVSTGRDHTLAIVYLGLVPTGLCTFLQAVGQRTVPPEKASLIYALDPLYAAIVAYFTLGERLYLQGFLGGALIVAGILVSSWQPVPPTVQAKESRTLSL